MIFGAGASIPFFKPTLTTEYLTQQILNPEKWREVIDRYNDSLEKRGIQITTNEVISFLYKIKSKFPKYNFEQICEIVDKISSFSFGPWPGITLFSDILLLNEIQPKQKFEWEKVPFLFRTIIAESILNLGKVDNYEKLLKQQKNFIEKQDTGDKISLISLNYDDVILDSIEGLDVDHGFHRRNDRTKRFYLDVTRFAKAKKTISFPHGHLRFISDNTNDTCYINNSTNANKIRWNKLNSNFIDGTLPIFQDKFAYNFNTFIVTGQTKDGCYNHLPYAFYYQKMAADILKSNIITVIGYSFDDADINRMLKSFLSLDTNNKILIVNYIEEKITKDLINSMALSNGKGLLKWLYEVSIGIIQFYEEFPAINRNQVGPLNDQVFLFKGGYERFLNQYSNYVLKDVLV
jgi:hypothetical protein